MSRLSHQFKQFYNILDQSVYDCHKEKPPLQMFPFMVRFFFFLSIFSPFTSCRATAGS